MSRLPSYCVHKGRNLAYVTIRGREHYLGRAHSPESHAAYREALAAFLAGEPAPPARPRRAPTAFTVGELAERWYLAEVAKRGPRHQAAYEAAYAAQPLAHPLPHSEAAQDGCVLLPLYAGMTAQEQAQVVAALAQACAR